MAEKRIFIAFDIPADLRARAAEYALRLRKEFPLCRASWTKPGNLHFTLRFIGEIDTRRIAEVSSAIRSATAIGKPEIQLFGTGVFPTVERARVLWLGAEGDIDSLARLKDEIDNYLEKSGFRGDREHFTPHLTLARIKSADGCRKLIDKHLASSFRTPPYTVTELVLYESELGPGGSIYTPIEKFSIGQAGF